MKKHILFALICLASADPVKSQIAVTYNINLSQERNPISKYIYGINMDSGSYPLATVRRLGGNRLSAYNWENNYSNAGNDWYYHNDSWLPSSLALNVQPASDYTKAGSCLTTFHNTSLAQGAMSLITLPMAGYVANDGNGPVTNTQLAPSPRWAKVINKKGSPFTLTPNTTDGIVYVDEEINFLKTTYGNSTSPNGIKAYIMDNEPGIWSTQFATMRNNPVTYNELLTKSIALASTIKEMDPGALVFGSESYGFNEWWNLQNASDRGNYATDHWFIDTYLKAMKSAGDAVQKRLLDVFTIHYYSSIDNVVSNDVSDAVRSERVQSTRTLWDPAYTENSWITQSGFAAEFPLIPHIKNSINAYYPQTKFGITEYDFGAHNDISGGIAQADALGVFGRNQIDYATIFGHIDGYVKTAFDLYLNYDGNQSKYGSIKVQAISNNVPTSTIYASVNDNTNTVLHSIVNNKNSATAINATINIQGNINYDRVEAFYFNQSNTTIKHAIIPASAITNNTFTYQIPAYSVYHFVFTKNTPLPVSLTSFTGKKQNDGIRLNWATASEKDNASFEILRSTDGKQFTAIGSVPGRINSDVITNYSFTDAKPDYGTNYYQLRQTDLNGNSSTSDIIPVTIDLKYTEMKISEIPDKQNVEISIYSPIAIPGMVYITDIRGQKLAKQAFNLVKGYNTLQMPLKQTGIFIATLTTSSENISKKFILH